MKLPEEIWVDVAEGSRRTGYNHDHVRRLARENFRLPENERRLRVRKEGQAYVIWLPDLVNFYDKVDNGHAKNPDEEIWVNTSEAAEATGYNLNYISQIGAKMWNTPEGEREIRVKRRAGRYEFWLPDLLLHKHKGGRGPRKNTD
jgi:hypothetical protein